MKPLKAAAKRRTFAIAPTGAEALNRATFFVNELKFRVAFDELLKFLKKHPRSRSALIVKNKVGAIIQSAIQAGQINSAIEMLLILGRKENAKELAEKHKIPFEE